MLGKSRSQWIGVPVVLMFLLSLPLLIGQGCPGFDNKIDPVSPPPTIDGEPSAAPGVDGNTPPRFTFEVPEQDLTASVGDIVTFEWTDKDPDDDAVISLILDPDLELDNGNEIIILSGRSENLDGSGDTYSYDTSVLQQTTYRVIARVTDGVNPAEIVVATGRLIMMGDLIPSNNPSPTISVLRPVENMTVGQSETFSIEYCGNDPNTALNEPGTEGYLAPQMLVILDTDNNPTNDVDLSGDDAQEEIEDICRGDFPRYVNGVFVLDCQEDNDCVLDQPADEDEEEDVGGDPLVFDQTLDVADIPPQPDGSPYHVRVTMWDQVNPPVHDYARGTISISGSAKKTVDLAEVGRQVSGTRILGFDQEAWLGSTGVSLGDYDNDGADDFLIVARYGQPFERGKVGSAFLIYGIPPEEGDGIGGKYGSEININNWGDDYRGTIFVMGQILPSTNNLGENTDGLTSVTRFQDMTGDGSPEIIMGFPRIVGLIEHHDDDPCDDDGITYSSLWPHPQSTSDPGNDNIQYWGDPSSDYLTMGWVIYIESTGVQSNATVEIAFAGQADPATCETYGEMTDEGLCIDASSLPGIRWRGLWYGGLESAFGKTVKEMADLTNGGFFAQKDGDNELLISAPYGGPLSGLNFNPGVVMMWIGTNFTNSSSAPVKSLPTYITCPNADPCNRCFEPTRQNFLYGEQDGDEFGYASGAGDFNLDGHEDILAGAPGADRDGVIDGGIVYIIFGRLDFGDLELSEDNPPRVEIYGTEDYARLGERTTKIGDVNADGIDDIAIASPTMDSPTAVNAGFVSVIFGGQRLTGENAFYVDEIGSSNLQGVKFYGTLNSGAGEHIESAGDFNGDGIEDLLIVAADEVQELPNGEVRRGVAYLVFGGPHLVNREFLLSQVGTDELPGLIFVSPYKLGTIDEASITWAGAAGDVNADGFDDVLLGLPLADYTYPQENPVKRRTDAGEVYLIYGNNAGG